MQSTTHQKDNCFPFTNEVEEPIDHGIRVSTSTPVELSSIILHSGGLSEKATVECSRISQQNLLPLGVASLKRYEGSFINCALPENFAYGPVTFESGHLRSIAISTDGDKIKFIVSQQTDTQTDRQAGQYSITAVANGDDGLSLQANRFFEILDNEDFILACKNYRQNIMDGTELIWSFPEVWPMRLRFEILHRTGNFHYFPWNNQRICLSPKLRFNSLLSSDTNENWSRYTQNTAGKELESELIHQARSSKTNTLVILPDFLRQLPVQGQLDACMRVNHPHLENLKSCLTVDVWSATTCDHCSLEAPNFIREFQRACMTSKMHEDQITLGIAENPSFCSMLPLVEEDIRMCIRSLPSSSLYINKCSHALRLTEKLVGALESVSLANYENLLPLSSGLEAIATIATEITFTTMNRIQSKLAEAAYVLPQLLSESSFKSVYELARRFTKTAVYLLEGMRYQHENPTPALKSIQQQELDYETDIDADPIDSLDTLILNNLRGAQILSAKAMTGVLAKIDALLASSFHEVLVPGGSMFQEIFSTHNSVRFCRVMTRDLSNDHVACGESKIGIPNVTDLLNYEDIVVRTSSFTDNIYDFFNRGQDNPGSNLVSLTFYAEGAALNLSDTKFPFRFTLRKDTNASGCTNSDLEFEEQEVQLPEPVVAVDGTLVYQLLIMHRFEVDQEEANFVFQLHPSETATCPQYLVVARYTIPPNLQVVDDYGSFYWAMLPSSTLACKNVSTSGKMQQIYSLYIYPDVLSKLKNEAVARTRHLKIRTEELKHFYIGYRQLSASELNCYDERNPPPVPYLFRGRINTTAYVSASMPSCLHITPGEDAWRRSGCKAVSSPNSDEVLCECTHLTTFAVGISPMFESAQFKYILQGEHSMRISIPVYVVIVAIVSSTLLMAENSPQRKITDLLPELALRICEFLDAPDLVSLCMSIPSWRWILSTWPFSNHICQHINKYTWLDKRLCQLLFPQPSPTSFRNAPEAIRYQKEQVDTYQRFASTPAQGKAPRTAHFRILPDFDVNIMSEDEFTLRMEALRDPFTNYITMVKYRRRMRIVECLNQVSKPSSTVSCYWFNESIAFSLSWSASTALTQHQHQYKPIMNVQKVAFQFRGTACASAPIGSAIVVRQQFKQWIAVGAEIIPGSIDTPVHVPTLLSSTTDSHYWANQTTVMGTVQVYFLPTPLKSETLTMWSILAATPKRGSCKPPLLTSMGNIKHSSDFEIPYSSLLFIPEGNANSSPEGSNKSVEVMGCMGRSVSTSTNLLDPLVSSTPDLVQVIVTVKGVGNSGTASSINGGGGSSASNRTSSSDKQTTPRFSMDENFSALAIAQKSTTPVAINPPPPPPPPVTFPA
ncbi:polycystin 1-related protein [Echinococcus granulosus]|uniref:Polycystin 1-related protein n=1 Tax=Echinococcus granulosus TaxID=6210 RepID=W6U3T6_ECHGR|nr:polycystin 1-related protein [Echinococcus granulosus]EUB55760.1 polycystin 1-related protein [Echinococcus granulosus]